jgi:hypothetical protein
MEMKTKMVTPIAASKQPIDLSTRQKKERSHTPPLTDECNNSVGHMQQQQRPLKPALVRSIEESRKARALRFQRQGITNEQDIAIRFTTVTIREYPVTIGDNPTSRSGPPLTIEWKYDAEQTLDLVDYEDQLPGPRRVGPEMLVPPSIRVDRLRQAGMSRAEIVKFSRPVNIARRQRQRTYETLHMQPLQACGEKVARNVLNLLTLGERKRNERKFLEPYVLVAKNSQPDKGRTRAEQAKNCKV